MYKVLIYFFCAFFFLDIVMAEVVITEIMYDPECSDSYCEYVEIYNNGTNSVNITSWHISDDNVDSLERYDGQEIILPSYGYGLIVDSDSRVYAYHEIPETTIWIYVDDNAIGNGLSNDGTVILKDENLTIIQNITYSGSTNGMAYGLVDMWNITEASPGKSNVNENPLNYSEIIINEFLPNPAGDDSQNLEKGEWVELYNPGENDLDLLGFYFKDRVGSDADVTITKTTTQNTIIQSKDYLVVYANGVGGFLNNDGYEEIQFFDLNNNLIDSLTYEGSDEDVSWSLTEGKWQKTTPTPGKINLDEKRSVESEIKIEEVYDLGDGKAEWGDIIRVKLYAYKGNTEKNVVWIWVEDSEGERITKKSKFDVYKKFENITLTYPIFIPEDCEGEFRDGLGRIVVSGLDDVTYEDLEIRERPLCKTSKGKRVSKFEYKLISFPESVKSEQKFSSLVKVKNNDNEDLKVDVWGYVYSGRKKYVNEERGNLQTLNLKPGEEEMVELNTLPIDIEKGKPYRFKVKILKEGRKTPYDITKEIKIVSENIKKPLDSITGSVIYESRGVKAERSAVFVFGGLMTSLSAFTFWRKWN